MRSTAAEPELASVSFRLPVAASWRAVTSGPVFFAGPFQVRRNPFGPQTVRLIWLPVELLVLQVSESVLPASTV